MEYPQLSGGGEFNVSRITALIRSRYIILGAATLAFGIVALGANLVNEYYAYGGERSLSSLPSLRSALIRVSAVEHPRQEQLEWRIFARQQLYRAGGAALPYALPWKRGLPEPRHPPPAGVAVGVLALVAALAGTRFARRDRALWATLALFGFFWAVPMRDNVFISVHDHEALYYVGVPLALFGTALAGARRTWGERAPVAAAGAAAGAAPLIFAVSVFQMQTSELRGQPKRPAETVKSEMSDFDAIREKTRGEAVAVLWRTSTGAVAHEYIAYYYLAGSVLAEGEPLDPRMGRVKYVVGDRDYEGGIPLTPGNRIAFLYEVEPFHLHRAALRRVESAEPTARADFDLYREGGSLYYVKEPCGEDDARERFFLSVHPVDAADLPEDRRELGHDSLNFDFASPGVMLAPPGIAFDGKCAIRRQLPYYPIASISTGQWTPGEGESWSAEIELALSAESIARYESVYQAAKSSGEPLIRSDFDVYMEGGALTYLKAPCAESDTRGRFFLSVHPVDNADLPEGRRELGHDGLNFDFSPDGIIFADKCMIRREPPDCPILKIATGQRMPGVGGLWTGAAAAGD